MYFKPILESSRYMYPDTRTTLVAHQCGGEYRSDDGTIDEEKVAFIKEPEGSPEDGNAPLESQPRECRRLQPQGLPFGMGRRDQAANVRHEFNSARPHRARNHKGRRRRPPSPPTPADTHHRGCGTAQSLARLVRRTLGGLVLADHTLVLARLRKLAEATSYSTCKFEYQIPDLLYR